MVNDVRRARGFARPMIQQGKPMIELPFARDEYQQRLKKIRAEMAKRRIELLIVNDVANQH